MGGFGISKGGAKGKGKGKSKEDGVMRHARRIQNGVVDEIAGLNANNGQGPNRAIAEQMVAGSKTLKRKRVIIASDLEVDSLRKYREAVAAAPFITAAIDSNSEDMPEFFDQIIEDDDNGAKDIAKEPTVTAPDPMLGQLREQNNMLVGQINMQGEQLRIQGVIMQNLMMSLPRGQGPEEQLALPKSSSSTVDLVPVPTPAIPVEPLPQLPRSIDPAAMPPPALPTPTPSDPLPKAVPAQTPLPVATHDNRVAAPPTPDARIPRDPVSPSRSFDDNTGSKNTGNKDSMEIKGKADFSFDVNGVECEKVWKKGKKLCESLGVDAAGICWLAQRYVGILRTAEAALAAETGVDKCSSEFIAMTIQGCMENERTGQEGGGKEGDLLREYKDQPLVVQFERCFRASYGMAPDAGMDVKKMKNITKAMLESYWSKIELLSTKLAFMPMLFLK